MAINNTSINPLALVEEVFAIGNAIERACIEADEAKDAYEAQKSYVKYLRGQRWLQYKTGTLNVPGMEKETKAPTDKAVDYATDADEECYASVQKANDLWRESNIASSYADAMDAKKKGLQEAIKLALAKWFSDLKVTSAAEITNFAETGSVTGVIENAPARSRKPTEDGGRAALRARRRERTKEEEK